MTRLKGKEQRTLLVEDRRVRTTCAFRKLVLGHLSRLWIELTDIRVLVRREPDVALFVFNQAMGAGSRRFKREFFHLTTLRIEPSEHVGEHARPPYRPVH